MKEVSQERQRQIDSSNLAFALHTAIRKYTDTTWSVAMWNIIHPLPEIVWSEFCQQVDLCIRDNLSGNLNREILIRSLKNWLIYWDYNGGSMATETNDRNISLVFNALWKMVLKDEDELDSLVLSLSNLYENY